MTLPVQEVIKSAKQVYNHLDLRDRISRLTTIPVKTAAVEVRKMQTIYLTDKSELSKVIRQFLQWSPPKGQKKSINDLISRLDATINDLCSCKVIVFFFCLLFGFQFCFWFFNERMNGLVIWFIGGNKETEVLIKRRMVMLTTFTFLLIQL